MAKVSLLFIVSVPVLYALGILAYFALFRNEMSLTNLVGYMASLSTTIMVLIYILTTTRQLDTMHHQLEEMQYSRSVQVQPLPYFEKHKTVVTFPRFYTDPTEKHNKLILYCEVDFSLSISNIGSGPAISVDFIPSVCKLPFRDIPRHRIVLATETIAPTVDCLSLREGDSHDLTFHFGDREFSIIEALLAEYRVLLRCEIIFKNVLGMAFREKVSFWASLSSENDLETIRSCLKTAKSAEIEFETHVKSYERLRNLGKAEAAKKLLDHVNEELKKRTSGEESLELTMEHAPGSFVVGPISDSEYEKSLSRMKEQQRRVAERIYSCWKERDTPPSHSFQRTS